MNLGCALRKALSLRRRQTLACAWTRPRWAALVIGEQPGRLLRSPPCAAGPGLLAGVLLAALLAALAAGADELILKNGRRIQGAISKRGSTYAVRLSSGRTLLYPESAVAGVSATPARQPPAKPAQTCPQAPAGPADEKAGQRAAGEKSEQKAAQEPASEPLWSRWVARQPMAAKAAIVGALLVLALAILRKAFG